ncbi:MAG: DNA/RNA nuclease SfsA [Desulfobulbaceae bacterium]|nr:DNA/RNA nuclease SfsA [Desulfobulbaceae bacterium]
MLFPEPLQPATLLRRYKRFLADVQLPDGREITVHCPNSGSMLGCGAPGLAVMISRAVNPDRKYPCTLEMVKVGRTWVGVNTALTNRLVREALEAGLFPELGEIHAIRPEVKTGHSRLDFRLETAAGTTWVEVKNCSLAEGNTALFPDAVTERGTRHLRELLSLRQAGQRAAIIFCVQRDDAEYFAPAAAIDPRYANTLAEVSEQGVLALAGRTAISPVAITLAHRLPVLLGAASPGNPSL